MPTRKQQSERDARQRARVRREIRKNVDATLGNAFADSMARLKAIRPAEWQEVQSQDVLMVQAKGPGKGWWGPPKGSHGASGAGAGGGIGEFVESPTPGQLRGWNRQINKWDGPRRDMAIGALETMMAEGAAAYVIEQDGTLKGIAALGIPGTSPGANVYPGALYLEYLATGERGYGYNMMRGMAEQASKSDLGLAWYAVPGAQAFYEKIGFKPTEEMPFGGADFIQSKMDVDSWLEKGIVVHLSDAEILEQWAAAEPENGAFAMPKGQAEELATQAAKGTGKGWWGPPKGTHGKTLSSIPGHVWERAAQRTGYKAVRNAVKALKANPVLPPSRNQKWHMPLTVGGQIRGYLVGSDSFAQTVLGARMTPKRGSVEIEI